VAVQSTYLYCKVVRPIELWNTILSHLDRRCYSCDASVRRNLESRSLLWKDC